MLSGAGDLVFLRDSMCLVISIYVVIRSGLVSVFKAHRGHPHGAVHITCMLAVPGGALLACGALRDDSEALVTVRRF